VTGGKELLSENVFEKLSNCKKTHRKPSKGGTQKKKEVGLAQGLRGTYRGESKGGVKAILLFERKKIKTTPTTMSGKRIDT